jgi:hypothetical protein
MHESTNLFLWAKQNLFRWVIGRALFNYYYFLDKKDSDG